MLGFCDSVKLTSALLDYFGALGSIAKRSSRETQPPLDSTCRTKTLDLKEHIVIFGVVFLLSRLV